MIDAVKEMFSKYCVFSGRTSRANFWWAVLGTFILSFIVGMIGMAIGGSTESNGYILITTIWSLIILLPCLGMQVRRLHDINKSGWFWFLYLIPFVGGIILLVFFCLPSVDENNKY